MLGLIRMLDEEAIGLIRGAVIAASIGVLGMGCKGGDEPEDTDAPIPITPFVLDGEFSDWDDPKVGVEDPSGDGATGGFDFGSVHLGNDPDYLYLAVDLGAEVALNEEPNFKLYIDTDANPETGIKVEDIGAELVWDVGESTSRP